MKTSFLFIFLFIATFSQKLWACTCMRWENIHQMMEQADAVYLAVPETSSVADSEEGPNIILKTPFSIVRTFKGQDVKRMMIFSWESIGGSNCGVSFKKDDALYLLFAYRDQLNRLHVNSCSVSSVSNGDKHILRVVRKLSR
jgi:hypothetical protein